MTSRRFRPCSGCGSSNNTNRKQECYEERKTIHIVTDFTIGTPVALTLKESPDTILFGYYLDFNRSKRTIHFQAFGDTDVQELTIPEICTIKYSSH